MVRTDLLSFGLPVHIIWGNAMSGIIYQSVTLAPTSDWHTYPCMHTTRPATEFPAIHAVSCGEIIQTGCFCATTGEAQEGDYESESQNLPGALPSAPGREQAVGEYLLLLQAASSHPPSPPAVSYPPAQTIFFFCTLLGDHFVLLYDINLCVLQRKQKLSIFTGFCGYCRAASTSTWEGLHTVFIAEELQCGLRNRSWKPPGKQSERKTLKEDWGMSTES